MNIINPVSKNDFNESKSTPKIKKIEKRRSLCLHRDDTGEKLIMNSDNIITCTICGATFRPFCGSKEEVKQIFDDAINVLETIKIMTLTDKYVSSDEFTKLCKTITYLRRGTHYFDCAEKDYKDFIDKYRAENFGYNSANLFTCFDNQVTNSDRVAEPIAPKVVIK